MMSIDLNKISKDKLSEMVVNLADQISNNKDLRVQNSCLVVLDQSRKTPPSWEVLESLRRITKEALENTNLKGQFDIINALCQEIIWAHPLPKQNAIVERLDTDLLSEIIFPFALQQAA